MDISTIIGSTPDSVSKAMANRIKERRLDLNFTQKAFAKRAGVGYDAYRRFENTGEITLRNLLLCAVALDCIDDFGPIFSRKSYQSIDEVIKMSAVKKRKRGARNE